MLGICSIFFYFKSCRSLSLCLIPFCLPPALAYLNEEFYFFSYLASVLFLILTTLPPLFFQNHFSLLWTSHILFSLLCNILMPFPSLLILAQLSLLLTLLCFFCNFIPFGSLHFLFYFKPHTYSILLLHFAIAFPCFPYILNFTFSLSLSCFYSILLLLLFPQLSKSFSFH